MTAKKVGYAVGTTQLLRQSQPTLPDAFRYFPESLGFVPRCLLDSGVIVRSIPNVLKNEGTVVAPLFSLLGGSGIHRPLFLVITEGNRGSPLEFVEKILCDQFSKLWLDLSLRHGFLPEFHGQNLLLAMSPELKPLGHFYYRDLDGLLIDWDLRGATRLPTLEDMPRAWSWYETYGTLRVGNPYCELVWWKARVSLFAYLDLFMNELDKSLREWQRDGFLGGAPIQPGTVTRLFSEAIRRNVEILFDVRLKIDYDVYHSLNRFMLALLSLRRQLLETAE